MVTSPLSVRIRGPEELPQLVDRGVDVHVIAVHLHRLTISLNLTRCQVGPEDADAPTPDQKKAHDSEAGAGGLDLVPSRSSSNELQAGGNGITTVAAEDTRADARRPSDR